MEASYRWRRGGGAKVDLINGPQGLEFSSPAGFYLLKEHADRQAGSSRDVSPTVWTGPPGRDNM